jgi:tRNA-splicing endonuclease subunit Sen34
MTDSKVSEPFPIFQVGDKYLLHDVNVVSHIRREHHMCGVLVGNLPQAAQQNIYSGIPLVLMPEEARLLVDNKHAYLVDDVAAHSKGMSDVKEQDRITFVQSLHEDGLAGAAAVLQEKDTLRKKALGKKAGRGSPDSRSSTPSTSTLQNSPPRDDLLFDSSSQRSPTPFSDSPKPLEPFLITPTTSYPPLVAQPPDSPLPLPEVPSAYPLYKHLQSKGYYLSPGLRFGCQYCAYPGDPLRFHSHFLVTGMGWDDEIDLMDIVGGGRLGTGVKKGYMIGGKVVKDGEGNEEGDVRAFSFEWAVM